MGRVESKARKAKFVFILFAVCFFQGTSSFLALSLFIFFLFSSSLFPLILLFRGFPVGREGGGWKARKAKFVFLIVVVFAVCFYRAPVCFVVIPLFLLLFYS